MRIVIVLVGNELAVDFLLKPWLRHLVHDAFLSSIGSTFRYLVCAGVEVAHVFTRFVHSVPLVLLAVTADLENESHVGVVCSHDELLFLNLNITVTVSHLYQFERDHRLDN